MRRATAIVLGTVFLGNLALTLPAQEPAKKSEPVKSPWQRLLQGDDAKKAEEQEKKLEQLQEAGQFAEALKVAEALAALRAQVQGADHWEAVNARAEVDAIRRVLRSNKEEQQGYSGAFALQRKADALRAKGHYREAHPLEEQLLALRRRVLGEEHPVTAESYNNAAYIQYAQGKYPEAEEGYRKALAIDRKVLGEEHPSTALRYNNLATSLIAQLKYKEAEESLQKALALRRKVLGEEHSDTAASYYNLAGCLNVQTKYKEAGEGFHKALVIWRKVLGEEHPYTAAGYNYEAYNLSAQGKYKEAEEGLRKALAIRRKVLGEEHPDTAESYNTLAANLNAQGTYSEAEDAFRKALAIRRKILGEGHPYTADSYNNLALILNAQGKYREAKEGYSKALAIYRKVFGEEHAYTADSYNNVAGNLDAQGKYKEAEEIHRKALAIKRRVLGEENSSTARSYHNLAHNLNSQRKYVEAEQYYRKALTIFRKALGEEHPTTAFSYNSVAANLDAQDKYSEAEQGYRKALAICRNVLGEEHPHTALCENNLAYTLNEQGKYPQAEEIYRKALALRRKVLGEKHPDTVLSYNNLALNLINQGKYKEAETCLRSAAESFAQARLHIAATGLDRVPFTGEHSPLAFLAAMLARNSKPDEAWQRFEESLARGTWDDFNARLRRPLAERNKQAQITASIDQLNKLIEKASVAKPTSEQSKRRDELLSQLRQAYDELAAFTQQLDQKHGPIAGQVSARAQIQASLPGDTAFVAWLDLAGEAKAADPNGEHWAILLRSSGDPIWMRLSGSGDKGAWTDADKQLPARLREALQSSDRPWQSLTDRLRKQRLDPLAPHLKDVRRLIVLPSTALAGVPVEVIADGYTISYAHSATMYAHLLRLPTPISKGLFVLADPVFDMPADKEKPQLLRGEVDKWDRLPGTRIEAASLQRLVDKDTPVQLLVDSEASEQRLNDLAQRGDLGTYRYIHLATHGEVNNAFPLRSAVILARDHLPDDKQRAKLLLAGQPIPDGRLTAEEALARWNLQCDLVTLSACQTALGRYERGEGYVGFAQSLILCGTRSVCLSLWKVDDTATALLMERFYQNLLGKRQGLDKPMPKAAALAEAKAWLRNLSRQEAMARAASVVENGSRAKGAEKLPLLPVPTDAAKTKADERPFAHPYFWAAFVLVGHAD